jgi:hypothetical protein
MHNNARLFVSWVGWNAMDGGMDFAALLASRTDGSVGLPYCGCESDENENLLVNNIHMCKLMKHMQAV